MVFEDLTILYLTANKLPDGWLKHHQKILHEAIGNTEVISLSRKPMDLGTNILDDGEYCISNIYKQMLRGALQATTDYIAIVEDDTLYTREHFEFRPPLDTFAYNMNRMNVFTWGTPMYHWKDRVSNAMLIAPRKEAVDALTERFEKNEPGTMNTITGELGRHNIEKKLGISRRKLMTFYTYNPVVRIDHEYGVDRLSKSHRKGPGHIKAYDIPIWGPARPLVAKFKSFL